MKKQTANFSEMLKERWEAGARVCVGPDPVWERFPKATTRGYTPTQPGARNIIYQHLRDVVEATAEYACAFKPNMSFFEGLGEEGLAALAALCRVIRKGLPHIPLILDFKRQDIGKTNAQLLLMLKEHGINAATFHGYLGREASQPFLDERDMGNFILCKTSNTGSGEFQDKEVFVSEEETEGWQGLDHEILMSVVGWPSTRRCGVSGFLVPLCQYVAIQVSQHWNTNGNCGLVVGATYPAELKAVRTIVGPDMPILVPGIGAQGGDLEATCAAGMNPDGTGLLINSSSGICYAAKGDDDIGEVAGREAKKLNDAIAACIKQPVS